MLADTRVLVIGMGKAGQAHVESLFGILSISNIAVYAPSLKSRPWAQKRGVRFLTGSLDEALARFKPTHCIVSVPAQNLYEVTLHLSLIHI